jgi:Methyltransferase domain
VAGPEVGATAFRAWRAPDAAAGSYTPGFLGLSERKLLYHLARNVYAGVGAVVELGAFCGASTCCLAAGLRENPSIQGARLHSFDYFVADASRYVDFIRAHFGVRIELGQSFEPLFRQATAEFADSIELHRGDLLKETWPADRPIELLFVDIAKTFALSGKVVTEFFPHLIPGRSVVVHQDFYHPSTFYLPIVMDYLSDYFTIVEPSCDWSVAFRLEAPIPEERLAAASQYSFSFMRQEAALRRMMRRVGMPGRDYLRLSKCAAVCTYFGDKRFKAELAAAISRSTIAPDDMWADALASCRALNASRLRARLYRDPALAPSPSKADTAYLIASEVFSAVPDWIIRGVRAARSNKGGTSNGCRRPGRDGRLRASTVDPR